MAYSIPVRVRFRIRSRIRAWVRARLHERDHPDPTYSQVSEPGDSVQPPIVPPGPPVVPPLSLSVPSAQPPTPPIPRRPPRPPKSPRNRANWLEYRLTERDWLILWTLYRLNSASIGQIYRLHFQGVTMRNCQYVMKRLLEWRAVVALETRIGGIRSGSGQRIYSLDPAAVRLLRITEGEKEITGLRETVSVRWSHRHFLTVTELYVQCVEGDRKGDLRLAGFAAEPACWWLDENGGILKPDAHVKVGVPGTTRRQHWWIEVDLGTESTPVLRAKFIAYLKFAARGVPGPDGAVPRVLVTVEDGTRRAALQRVVSRLGDDAGQFIHIATFDSAVAVMAAFAAIPITPHHKETP